MPVEHYENFPVASLLMPAELRPAVEAIYAFARSADDIADEGHATPTERLLHLSSYRATLQVMMGEAEEWALLERHCPTLLALGPKYTPLTQAEYGMFSRLARVLIERQLPVQPLLDLLDAFAQDVVKTRYADFAELADYCRRSANPVGRILLHLYGAATPANLARSDAICTSLQLINFWQDVAVDWGKGRVYIPQRTLQDFGISEQDLAFQRSDEHWQALMASLLNSTRHMMLEGAPLDRKSTR